MSGCNNPGPPLTIQPGATDPSENTSYSVYDSDNPPSGGPYHVVFDYSQPSTGAFFRRDPEIENEQPYG
jgi:hypothetical protein